MSGAYAHSGVDTSTADRGVAALVAVLKTIDTGRASRSVLASGHYAAVLEVAPNLGIAVGTDGVGSKLIVAEQTGRYDTVGIDCVAMNVNDVVCVGAEPIALLDYLAVERVDPDVMEAIAVGLKAGAEAAGVEIPGGEVAVLPELIKGHPSPSGFDLTAACFGTVALDRIVTGATCEPGDALIGLPSSGLHSNGYSLARAALDGAGVRGPAGGARRGVGGRRAARADRDLRARGARAAALRRRRARARAHHRRRAAEPAAAARRRRLRDRRAAAGAGGVRARAGAGRRRRTPRCGRSSTWAAASAPSCPPRRPMPRWSCSGAGIPGAARIGSVTGDADRVTVPALGLTFAG